MKSVDWVSLVVRAAYGTGTLLFLSAAVPVGQDAWRSSRAVSFGAVAAGQASILVLFRAEDCESHQPVIAALNQAHVSGAISVRGLVLDDTTLAARIMETAFPVESRSAPAVRDRLERLGYRRTPIVALIDSRGRPVLITEAMTAPWEQVEAVRLAQALARRSDL